MLVELDKRKVNFYIVFTDKEVILSKQKYESWREIQNDFVDYKASLGPWCVADTIEYLNEEHPSLNPNAEQQIKSLAESAHFEAPLTWCTSNAT